MGSGVRDLEELEREGFSKAPGCLVGDELLVLRDEAMRMQVNVGKACVRDIFRRSEAVRRIAKSSIPRAGMVPVRGILFDKTPGENWPVAWHQDLSIAVAGRVDDADGYTAWTVKEGVPHVQPPVGLLEQMITLRVHLDDTPAENGALRVLPRSHRSGRIGAARVREMVEAAGGAGVVCEADAGDGLWMKPLVLHASARSSGAPHRRVIHLEYAPVGMLSPRLSWYESVC